MAQQLWEKYEFDFIKEVAGVMSRTEIAEKLERTPAAVAFQAHRLGVSLGMLRCNRIWESSELALFGTHTDHEIKDITGRTLQSVQSKRYEINGRRNKK
jgi:hypothetical protein